MVSTTAIKNKQPYVSSAGKISFRAILPSFDFVSSCCDEAVRLRSVTAKNKSHAEANAVDNRGWKQGLGLHFVVTSAIQLFAPGGVFLAFSDHHDSFDETCTVPLHNEQMIVDGHWFVG
jgi:hypothetical protein